MNKSKLKKLFLLMCICVFAFVLSGCAERISTDVTVKSSKKASYSISMGLDDDLLSGLASTTQTTTKEIIKEYKAEGYTYSKKTIDGVKYHMFTKSGKNVKFSKVETELTDAGLLNVCLTEDYFYAAYDPQGATASALSSLMAATDDTLTDLTGISVYMDVSVKFNSKIKTTNGKLSKESKKASWTIKNADKKKTFYASTKKAKDTAKTTSVKNSKTYKTGKVISVSHPSSLAKMTLDGKQIKNKTAVKKKGTHTLTIWSRNGKVQTVSFIIK
jgi:hypothetical protein